ncbi:MAG: hypothetical protein ACOCP4_04245 [Candidatus Woesearchaeota archaeon]
MIIKTKWEKTPNQNLETLCQRNVLRDLDYLFLETSEGRFLIMPTDIDDNLIIIKNRHSPFLIVIDDIENYFEEAKLFTCKVVSKHEVEMTIG